MSQDYESYTAVLYREWGTGDGATVMGPIGPMTGLGRGCSNYHFIHF